MASLSETIKKEVETAIAASLNKCLPNFSQDIAENLHKLSLQDQEEAKITTHPVEAGTDVDTLTSDQPL